VSLQHHYWLIRVGSTTEIITSTPTAFAYRRSHTWPSSLWYHR